MDKAEFGVAAAALGLALDPSDVDSVFQEFDADKSGTVRMGRRGWDGEDGAMRIGR